MAARYWSQRSGRRLVRLALLVVVLLLACACVSRGASSAHQAAPALVAVVPAGSAARALQAATIVYEESTGDRVQVEVIGSDAYLNRISADLLSGVGHYDLVLLPGSQLPRWAAYHALRPVDGHPESAAMQPWLDGLRFEAQGNVVLYGLPTQPDPLVLWYRTDLLDAAGIHPRFADWQAFREAASRLNAPPARYGAAVAAGEFDAGAEYAAVLAGFDPAAMDALTLRGEISPPAVQALELLVGLKADGVASPDSGRYLRADVIAALAQGRASMGLAPLSAAERLLDCSANAAVCQDGQPAGAAAPLLAAAPLPGSKDCSAAAAELLPLGDLSAWVVPLRAAHPDAAARFAAWLVSTEGAQAWASGGGTPAHREVLGAHMLPGIYDLPGALCTRAVFRGMVNADQAWQALHTAAHAAIAQEKAPQQVLDAAGVEIRRALRQSGVIR